jgi:hypothetical protein
MQLARHALDLVRLRVAKDLQRLIEQVHARAAARHVSRRIRSSATRRGVITSL